MSSDATQLREEGPLEDLDGVIKYVVSKHKFIHEYRLQKLLYLSEVVSHARRLGRLTEAEFKPYMYGAYSEDVSDELDEEDPDFRTSLDKLHGSVVTAYHWDGEEEPNVEEAELIDEVIDASKEKTNQRLADWSKKTTLFEETEFDDTMDFEDWNSEVFQEDLEDEFSDLLNY